MDPILRMLFVLGYWATILGTFGTALRSKALHASGRERSGLPKASNTSEMPLGLGTNIQLQPIPEGSTYQCNEDSGFLDRGCCYGLGQVLLI